MRVSSVRVRCWVARSGKAVVTLLMVAGAGVQVPNALAQSSTLTLAADDANPAGAKPADDKSDEAKKGAEAKKGEAKQKGGKEEEAKNDDPCRGDKALLAIIDWPTVGDSACAVPDRNVVLELAQKRARTS